MSARFIVNSEQRATGTASNFRVNTWFQTPISGVSFADLFLPFSWRPIDSTNNTLIFNEGGADIVATVGMPTTWAMSDTAMAIQAALNAHGTQTYTVTFAGNTGFLTISAAANFSIKFATMAADGLNTLNRIMGFAATNTTPATSITSSVLVMPWGPNYVYICSSKLINQGSDTDTYATLGKQSNNAASFINTGYSIFMTVPIASPPNTTIVLSANTFLYKMVMFSSPNKPEFLDFKILNPWTMQPLQLNADWQMELSICIEKNDGSEPTFTIAIA